MRTRRHNRRGFTLVELSIVLVIIGLIIGGVLTGQQIIQNARVTNALNAIQSFEAQFQTYVQNYGALPGDDKGAPTRFPGAVPSSSFGDGSGSLNAGQQFDSPIASDETSLVWLDLRAAGLVKSQAVGGVTQPPNPFGGVYGFQNGAFGTLSTNVLCLNNVPGSAASAIDTRLDDGVGNTGNVQAIETPAGGGTTGTLANPYDSSKTYTMCVKM